MRITHRLMAQTMNHNLGAALRRLYVDNKRLSTGKMIHSPSDDPVALEASMRLRTMISQHEQYAKNISDAKAWLSLTESSLGQITEAVHRAREQAVKGASGTLTADDRQDVAREIFQIRDDIFNIGNTRFADRYIFGGTRTQTAPFVYNNGTYEYVGMPGQADPADPTVQAGSIAFEIGDGIEIKVGVHGDVTIMPIIEALGQLLTGLENDDTDAINSALGSLDEAFSNLLRWRAEVGARMNRLELAEARYADDALNLKGLLSDKEDVDFAETIMNLKQEENVYRAALATGARIIQPTLIDFLR